MPADVRAKAANDNIPDGSEMMSQADFQGAGSFGHPVELAPDYYLQHFQGLIEHVQQLYADILSADELGFIKDFGQLSHGAACLLVRLLCRNGDWFRLDKLSYAEIPDIQVAANELITCGMLTTQVPPVEHFAKGVTLTELRGLLKLARGRQSSTKLPKRPTGQQTEQEGADSVQKLSRLNKSQLVAELEQVFTSVVEVQTIPWLELNCRPSVSTLMLCYFGNSYQELSQFVLVDLGIQQFEPYSILAEDRKFDNRSDIVVWQELDELQELAAKAPEDILTAPQLPQLLNPTSSFSRPLTGKIERCRIRVARQLERIGEHAFALKLYRLTRQAPARERSVRCLEQLGRLDEAVVRLADYLDTMIDAGTGKASIETEELECLKRLARRLTAKVKKAIQADQLQMRLPAILQSPGLLPKKLELCGVGVHQMQISHCGSAEQSLVEHINQNGWRGMHANAWYVENQLLCALFGLAFWDIIFARQKGQFVHPFQLAPLDMFHPGFIPRRQACIERRMAELSRGDYSAIDRHLSSKQGINNAWVNWKWLRPELITLLLETLSAQQLTGLLRLILNDPRFMRSGMPDLLLQCDTPEGKALAFVEVKGPGDSLRDNQSIWLSHLAGLGLRSHLCYLSWTLAAGAEQTLDI